MDLYLECFLGNPTPFDIWCKKIRENDQTKGYLHTLPSLK